MRAIAVAKPSSIVNSLWFRQNYRFGCHICWSCAIALLRVFHTRNSAHKMIDRFTYFIIHMKLWMVAVVERPVIKNTLRLPACQDDVVKIYPHEIYDCKICKYLSPYYPILFRSSESNLTMRRQRRVLITGETMGNFGQWDCWCWRLAITYAPAIKKQILNTQLNIKCRLIIRI